MPQYGGLHQLDLYETMTVGYKKSIAQSSMKSDALSSSCLKKLASLMSCLLISGFFQDQTVARYNHMITIEMQQGCSGPQTRPLHLKHVAMFYRVKYVIGHPKSTESLF